MVYRKITDQSHAVVAGDLPPGPVRVRPHRHRGQLQQTPEGLEAAGVSVIPLHCHSLCHILYYSSILLIESALEITY